MVQIYFIRHGETDYNKLGISQGHKPVDINQKGIKQAIKTGNYLHKYRNNKPFDCIISSPLLRARSTALFIKDALNYKKTIFYDPLLKELDMGDYAGQHKKTRKELLKTLHEKLKSNYKDPIEYQLNKQEIDEYMKIHFNMETKHEALIRAKQFKQKLKTKYSIYQKIIVVCHGKIMSHIFESMFHLPYQIPKTDNMSYNNDTNCFISLVEYNKLKHKFKMLTTPSNIHLDYTL